MNCPTCGESFAEVEVQLACEVHCPECGALLTPAQPGVPAPLRAAVARSAAAAPKPAAAPPPPVPAAPQADATTEGTPFGRYRLLAPLGQGGVGEVWKAYDTVQRRLFAVKIIRADQAGGADAVQRFLAEAGQARKLRHAHILSVHDAGEIDGRAFVTVDFVEGKTFQSYLDALPGAKNQRPAAELLRHEVGIVAQVADAVAYAHGEGVAHRMLKPSNVLLDRKDRPYVMDFGLARALGPEAGAPPPAIERRLIGAVLGTPAYLSPEQAVGDRARIGPASDSWALGVILYQVLAGRMPFAGGPWEAIAAVLDAEPPAIAKDHRPVTDDLEALCFFILAKDPAQRPAATEIGEELRRWLRGEPARLRRPGLLSRWSRKLGF